MSGKTIEHFQILRELGRGGMGIVYLAEDKRLGRKVALKFLTDENLSREKILKEARLASQLQHPGIVTIYDVLESPSGTCIVMEYVEGDSLEHFLKTHRIDIPFALRLARQITEIVADAHQYNLIHGDLKPGNIIITPQGGPKLLDFGLAGLVSTPADTLSISGTFPYIAPEKIIGSPNTEQTDIYALGNIFYRLFTGISPFEKKHQSAQIYAIMHDIPEAPSLLNKKLPDILGGIILRCLEKEPKSRYTSAKVLLSDLNAVELSDIREKPGISPRALWTNLFVFIIIFGILAFLFIKIQNAPEPMKSIEEISLTEPARLSIDYKTPDEQDMTTQTRLLGLIEVLQDQLERVSGLDVILKKPVIETGIDTSGASSNAENSLRIDLVRENNGYKIKYDLSNSDNSRHYSSTLNWKNFDDIFWVSNKMLSGLFRFMLDKEIALQNPPEDIRKNLLTFRHFSHGLYQFKEKYYQFAINNFNAALAVNPFFAQAHYYKGLSLFNLQRYRDALKEFYDALPEAGKQNPIDWETPILDKQDYYNRQFSILTGKDNYLVSSGLYLFYASEDRSIKIVDPKIRKISQIPIPQDFPRFKYIIDKYIYKDRLVLPLITIKSKMPYIHIATYNFQTRKWSISGEYKYPSETNLPFFYLIDPESKKLVKFDAMENKIVSAIDIPYSESKKIHLKYLDPQKDILVSSNRSLSAIYLVDLKNFTLQQIHDKIATMPGEKKFPELHEDYFMYTNEDTTRAAVVDLLSWKKIADIPLLKTDNYSFEFGTLKNNKTTIYKNALLVIQPDTCLHVYQFRKDRNLTQTAKFPMRSLAGEYKAIDAKSDFSKGEIFLYNKTKKQLLVLGLDEAPSVHSFKTKSDILQILINTGDFFIASDASKIFQIDKKNYDQVWTLPGVRLGTYYYSAKRNVAIFNDTGNKRLIFYQPATRKLLGFYSYQSKSHFHFDYQNDHVYFVEDAYFKSLDIDAFIRRNPFQIANIYDHIARSYYELGDYDNAMDITGKILTEFQSNSAPSVILQGKTFFKRKEYSRAAGCFLKAFSLLPEGNANKIAIENGLFKSGLYVWSRNVDLAEGHRLLEVLRDGVLFTDSKSFRKNQLLKLDFQNGDVIWKYPYLYHFKGLALTPNMLAYSECRSPSGSCSYGLLDLDKKQEEMRLPSRTDFRIEPQFYKYSDSSMIAYFRKTDNNPSIMDLIDFRDKSVKRIFNSAAMISDPFIYDNKVCFFTPDSFYSYNKKSNRMSSLACDFDVSKNGTIFQILYINRDRIYVSSIKNEIYRGSRTNLKFSKIERASKIFPGIAYCSYNKIVIFAKSGNKSLQYENAGKIKDISIQGNKIYLLESDYITCFEKNKMIRRYPLLWPAINFRVQGDRAYVLSSAGKIYAVDLNWQPNKLKKDLILSMN